MLRWKWLLALVGPVLAALALTVPVRAETVSCQSFADSYAERLAGSETLSPLFETPFSFAEMDWLEINGAAAVGVLKQADLLVGDGMAGELVCTPDGAIKQVENLRRSPAGRQPG